MMATEALDGLFGPTPFDMEQQQRQALMQQAGAYANQTPLQRAAGGMYQTGGMLGGMAAKALGGYNPNVKMAEDAQTIQKGIDHTTSDGLLAGAQQLKEVNPGLAAKYVQAAQALKMKEAEIGLKNANAKKALSYSQDPVIVRLLDRMAELEADGLMETPEYQSLQKQVDKLNTITAGRSGGGIFGLQGMGAEALYDPVTNATKLYNRNRQTGKLFDAAGKEVPDDIAIRLEKPAYNAGLKSNLAQAGAGGTAVGKASGESQVAIPKAEFQVSQTNKHLDELLSHPGFNSSVGATLKPGAKLVDGSKEAGFKARHEQIMGETFNSVYETLRGAGQITEVETAQATRAMNRMNTATSEVEYRKAAEDFRHAVNEGLRIIREKASMSYKLPPAQMPTGAAPSATPAPMPQVSPDTPVTYGSQPVNFKSPGEVRAAVGKTITREQARAILLDMQSRGIEIK